MLLVAAIMPALLASAWAANDVSTAPGSTITISLDGETITSNGNSVSGKCIVLDNGVTSGTLDNIDFDAGATGHALEIQVAGPVTGTLSGTVKLSAGANFTAFINLEPRI